MLKFAKYLSFILITFCNLTAETQNTNNAHNFYVGVSLNQCSFFGKRNDSASDDTPVTVVFTDNKRVHADGVYAGILFGYLFRIENFGIGPEFFYNFGKLNNKLDYTYVHPGTSTTAYSTNYKITNQTGLHARLGYFLKSYFLYTLFGFHSQSWRFETSAVHIDNAGVVSQEAYKTKKKNISTFSFGLGAQKEITENYSIGLECKFANIPFKKIAWTLNEDTYTTLNSSFKYRLRSINLKLIYTF